MVSSFLVFLPRFCNSSWSQLIIPKLYLSAGTAHDPVAWILFFALNSVPKTNLSLLKYYLFNFSFSFLCFMSYLSSLLKYLCAFLGSGSLMSYSNVLPISVLLWTLPFFKRILAHFSNTKFILMVLIIGLTIFISFSKSSSLLSSSYKSSTHNKWLSRSSVYLTRTISSVQLFCKWNHYYSKE